MSIGSTQPFRPSYTLTIAATTTAARATLPAGGEAALITNTASGTAFVRYGTDNTVVATLSDMPIPAGGRLLMHAGNLAKTVSVVLASGSGAVYVTRGDGTVY